MKFLRIAIIVLILIILTGFLIFSFDHDPQALIINSIEEWRQHYFWVVLIIFGMTVISTVAGLPVLYLSVALGFFLNYTPALAISWIGNLIAVMVTYLMVKTVYSNSFREKYGKKRLINGINRRIDKYGFWTVALSRGIYIIPTNIINFTYPLSKIPAKRYMTGTMIGLVPECIINVTMGYMIKHEILLLGSPEQNIVKILIIGGFIFLLSLLFFIHRIRRRHLKKSRLDDVVPLLGDEEVGQ